MKQVKLRFRSPRAGAEIRWPLMGRPFPLDSSSTHSILHLPSVHYFWIAVFYSKCLLYVIFKRPRLWTNATLKACSFRFHFLILGYLIIPIDSCGIFSCSDPIDVL